MSSQMRVLLWNECRQRRTQFLICLAWMVCGTAYCIAYEWSREFRAPVASFYTTAALFGLCMPIFLAMRTSLGELTDGTKSFSDALPISPNKRGWVRLAGGASVLIVPIAVGALLLSACLLPGWIKQAPPRAPPDAPYVRLLERESLSALASIVVLWRVTAIVICSATTFFALLSLLATALKAETHAGFAGAALGMLWFLGGSIEELLLPNGLARVASWIGSVVPEAMIVNYGYGDAKGSYGDLLISSSVSGPLLVNVLIQLALGAIFVRRYSRTLTRSARFGMEKTAVKVSAGVPRVWFWLPLPTRGLALAWLALRQSVPMCLPGLLIACLTTLLFQMENANPQASFAQRFADSLPSSMWITGLLWSVVVGAGIFSAEIDGRLGEFWRTLPISVWRLFAVKFVVGLTVVLLVLDATIIALAWQSPNWGEYESMNWPYVACFVPLHATMFGVAVAWTCLLRRAVLGGMAAIVSFALVNIALEWSETTRELGPVEVYNNLHGLGRQVAGATVDFSAHGFPLLSMAMGSIFLGSIVVGLVMLGRYHPRSGEQTS